MEVSSLNITVRQESTFTMKEDSTVEDLSGKFCKQLGIDEHKARFLLNGERLDKKSKLNILKMQEDDVIDAFLECRGGGPVPKNSILNSDQQILDALELNESFESLEFDDEQSNKEFSDNDERMVDSCKENNMNDEGNCESNHTIHYSDLIDNVGKEEESEVRAEFKKENLDGKGNIHKLPNLTKFEQYTVNEEKKSQFPGAENQPRKRKGKANDTFKKQKKKKVESSLNDKNQSIENSESCNQTRMESSESLDGNTPKQRKNLFQLFGIVSPFLRQKVATEEEVRRFSLAVHLWAIKKQGSVEFLWKNRLNDRHLKDILLFAGPSSKWKLIPDRSTTEYRNLWQNAFK